MIRSMTGFGEASAVHEGVHYFVEVRSLNSKYFKAIIRLPDALAALEPEMESILRRRLSRGTVTMTALGADASAAAAQQINVPALERYIDQIVAVRRLSQLNVTLDAAHMLMLPGVLQPPANEEQRLAAARTALAPLVERACDGVLAFRATEGQILAEELLRHREMIAERLAAIRERAPSVVLEYEQRLKARIETMIANAGLRVEPADLIREIAVYAERTDIAEEIARLTGHIEQFLELLTASGDRPVGRTLDFLAQEMLREANTIASKSPDSDISRATVDIKGAIDRIKEQIQNVE